MIKDASSGDDDNDLAMPRPMRRLRQLSNPRSTEVAADLEDDLADETSEDDAGDDWGETSYSSFHSCVTKSGSAVSFSFVCSIFLIFC